MDTKKLRQKILDLAIRGKLVPQDPNDEPASVLLERIRAEKEQLIKEGKIKRSKKSAATDKSHYENVPFEIPGNWVWTTLGEISNYGQCENVDVDKIAANEWILELEDIEKDSGRIIQKLCKDDRKACGTRHKFYRNEILYSKLRTYLNKVLVAPSSGFCTSEIIPIHCIETNPWFICFVLRSNYFLDYTASLGYGVKMPRLGTNDALISYIPLPPLSEQARIVDEVAKWNIIIDEIEDDKLELEAYVKKTKSKILDLAISGKLVPQDPNDEPAIELLKRINPDFEPCDNSHYENIEFDIPQNWVWATIGDIFEHNTGKALNASNPNGTMLDYITTSNLYWDRFELSVIKQMPFTESEIERCIVRKGDLLICEGGDVGRAAIWEYDYNIMIQNHIHRLRGKVDICTRYFFYLFMHYKLHNLIGGKGVAIQGLSSRDLHNLIIPVPSLKEQYDIASSIDLYFSKLDMITAEL